MTQGVCVYPCDLVCVSLSLCICAHEECLSMCVAQCLWPGMCGSECVFICGICVYEDERVCACECVGVYVQMEEGRVLIPYSL